MNRKDFPLLDELVYLDSGAGTLKPVQVVNAISDFYLKNPINSHSVDSVLGQKVVADIKHSRQLVAELIDASENEVIFTSGTTDSLNKIAIMFQTFLKEGDEILLSIYNHASNVVVWQEAAKDTGAKVVFSENLIDDINEKTKVIAYAQTNNTINKNISVERLYKEAKKHGAVLVNDAAHAIMHSDVSLHDADVVVFSGNKLYGPTGIGVLAVRKELLSFLTPSTFGGGAITDMGREGYDFTKGIGAFEPGTLNTAGIIGLGRAVEYFNEIDLDKEKEVAEYLFDKLSELDKVILFSKRGDTNMIFNIKGVNAQDVVLLAANKGVVIKAGYHCAMLIKEITEGLSTIRVSIAAYNNKEDIDKLMDILTNQKEF